MLRGAAMISAASLHPSAHTWTPRGQWGTDADALLGGDAVIRVEPHDGMTAFLGRGTLTLPTLSQEGHLPRFRKRALIRRPSCRHPHLRLPASGTVKTPFVLKLN